MTIFIDEDQHHMFYCIVITCVSLFVSTDSMFGQFIVYICAMAGTAKFAHHLNKKLNKRGVIV